MVARARFVYNVCVSCCRWRFLLECLHDVDKRLRTYNSRLYVAQGQLVAVLEELFHKWNVRQLTFQHDREPHSNAVEDIVGRLGESTGVKVSWEDRMFADCDGINPRCACAARVTVVVLSFRPSSVESQ